MAYEPQYDEEDGFKFVTYGKDDTEHLMSNPRVYAKLVESITSYEKSKQKHWSHCMTEEQMNALRNMPEYYLIWVARFEDLDEAAYVDELQAHCTDPEPTWIQKDGYEGYEDALKAMVRRFTSA